MNKEELIEKSNSLLEKADRYYNKWVSTHKEHEKIAKILWEEYKISSQREYFKMVKSK